MFYKGNVPKIVFLVFFSFSLICSPFVVERVAFAGDYHFQDWCNRNGHVMNGTAKAEYDSMINSPSGKMGQFAANVGAVSAFAMAVYGIKDEEDPTKRAATGAVAGAVAGAMLGSVVPLFGNVVGGVVGGAVGGIAAWFAGD